MARQPAALLLTMDGAPQEETIRKGALYAYHAGLQWGLAIKDRSAILFNSLWVQGDSWYQLPEITDANVGEIGSFLDGLRPNELLSGKLVDDAYTFRKPDRILQPVDEDLVDRLDHWRHETLRHARQIEGADNQLQYLFAQFFLLRSVEDRDLRELPPLRSALGEAGIDRDVLGKIYDAAAAEIQPHLFSRKAYNDIPDHVLCGIISDLYSPPGGRGVGLKYDFSWLEADVLGHAYEKYLSTILVESSKPLQQDLFETVRREVEPVSKRKATGVFYTPPEICRFLVEQSLDAVWRDEAEFIPVIADLACGSGSFLDAGLDSLLKRLKERDPARNWAEEIMKRRAIRGLDIDEMAVIKTQIRLWLRLSNEPSALPLPDLNGAILCGDSLTSQAKDHFGDDVDVMVGNPPFIATGKIESRSLLMERFKSARGRFDYSSLFVEQAVRLLKECGVYGLVVPNRLINNRDASALREILTSETQVRTIVDFGSAEVFKGVSAYIALLCGSKTIAPPDQQTQVVEITAIPANLPDVVLTNLIEGIAVPEADARVFRTALPRTGDPWLLLSPISAQARIRLGELEPLETFALVQQGIKTGANDIFIVKVSKDSGSGLVEVINGLGRSHYIDSTVLRPVVSGPEIRPYDKLIPENSLIYLYRNGAPLKEHEIASDLPATYDYLLAHKSMLESRSSLTAGLYWYDLIRSRSESWLSRPKLVMRDLAPRPSFAADIGGGIFLVGGTAVVPAEGVLLEGLMIYLNSAIAGWYISTTASPFQGSYFRFDPGQLSRIPVPERVAYDEDLLGELKAALATVPAAHEGLTDVDRILLNLTGLNEESLR